MFPSYHCSRPSSRLVLPRCSLSSFNCPLTPSRVSRPEPIQHAHLLNILLYCQLLYYYYYYYYYVRRIVCTMIVSPASRTLMAYRFFTLLSVCITTLDCYDSASPCSIRIHCFIRYCCTTI